MSAPDDSNAPPQPAPEAIASSPPAAAAEQTGTDATPSSPPDTPKMTPEERYLLWRRILDGGLVAMVLLLAFEAGFFPIRNSDLLLHRAVGRLVAKGEFDFHSDPFSFTTEGVRWVNHSWLFGWFVYGMHRIADWGDSGLIFLKALLLATLAELMLRLGRKAGSSLWVPGLCTALAILALSPRATMHSGVVSYLFLGLTLYLLEAPRRRWEGSENTGPFPAKNTRWFIPLLCVLWVNCDAWFLLGPALVGLYLIGEVLEGWQAPKGSVANLGAVLVASVAACLISPYHVYGLTLPEQLGFSPAGFELRDTQPFSIFFFAPLGNAQAFFTQPGNAGVAGLMILPLVMLGFISFAVTPASLKSWRAPVWLGFFILGALHGRAVPFFAIVAAPITSLNLLDTFGGAAERAPTDPDTRRRLLIVRVLTLLLAFATFTAGSAGWLHISIYGPDSIVDSHRPGWWTEFDQSLVKSAEQIGKWREENRIPADTRWFNVSPDAGNYLAWYAPGARIFIDSRISLYSAEVAHEFSQAREALYKQQAQGIAENPEEAPAEQPWAAIFSTWNIQYMIATENNFSRNEARLLPKLFDQQKVWTLCNLVAGTGTFGWNEGQGLTAKSFAAIRYDANRIAFGPHADKAPPKRTPPPPPPEWWQLAWQPEPPRSSESDNARIHIEAFKIQLKHKGEADNRDATLRFVLAAGGPFGPIGNGAFLSRNLATNITLLDPGPPGDLYLAVRAARRALEVNPEDGKAWLELGRAYSALSYTTREQMFGFSVPFLREIRQAQMVTALTRAARWNPGLESPHALLAAQFQSKYIDLTLQHRDAQLKSLNNQMISLQSGSGNSAARAQAKEQLGQQIEQMTEDLQRLQSIKKEQEDRFELDSANKTPFVKAQMAVRYGLAEASLKASREHLQQMKDGTADKEVVAPGFEFLVRLLIETGEIDEARELVQQEGGQKLLQQSRDRSLPVPPNLADEWYSALIDAAAGDYELADDALKNIVIKFTPRDQNGNDVSLQAVSAAVALGLGDQLLSQAVTAQRVNVLSNRWIGTLKSLGPIPGAPPTLQKALQEGGEILARQADYRTARAWLALEAGDTETARNELTLVMGRASRRSSALANFRARPLAEMLLGWIDANWKQ
jgi:hypothetical protein